MKGKAFAKVNLFLHVEKKLSNNYHYLNSLVCFTNDLFDLISISYNDHFLLETNDTYLNKSLHKNLIYKAYKILIDNFEIPNELKNVKITLQKKIPIAAGLGGGSSNAALTLKLLSKLWNLNSKLVQQVGIALGADLPICYINNTSFVSGIGEKIVNPVKLPKFYMLIVNPKKHLLTKEVFEKNTKFNNLKIHIKDNYNKKDFSELLNKTCNDLEDSAIKILPEIQFIKDIMIQQVGCINCKMSGSGASVIGIFFDKNQAQNALLILKKNHTNWWVALSKNL